MRTQAIRNLSALVAWGLTALILLLVAAFGLAVVSAWFHPELVDSEHVDLLAGHSLSGERALAVVLAGALPLPAALFALWQGVRLLRLCGQPGGCLPAGGGSMRSLGIGFAAAVCLGFAAEPVQGLLVAGRDGFTRTLAAFDPCSDSLGLFILASVVALVGQSLHGGER